MIIILRQTNYRFWPTNCVTLMCDVQDPFPSRLRLTMLIWSPSELAIISLSATRIQETLFFRARRLIPQIRDTCNRWPERFKFTDIRCERCTLPYLIQTRVFYSWRKIYKDILLMVNLKIFLTEQKFWRFQYAEWFFRTIKNPNQRSSILLCWRTYNPILGVISFSKSDTNWIYCLIAQFCD